MKVDITVPKESDTINLSLTNCRINIKVDPTYKFIRFSVHKGWCVKEYYNEFTEDQFSKLDTLVLYRSCIVYDATPLINFQKFEDWISDSLNYKWFKEYLKEINFESSEKKIEINIQTSYKNLLFRKGKILKQKKRIADAFGIPVDRLTVNFTKAPYVTRDGDLFVSGQ